MTRLDASNEPSMEDILASIRKIIAEDPPGSRPTPPAPAAPTFQAAPVFAPVQPSVQQSSAFSHTPQRDEAFDPAHAAREQEPYLKAMPVKAEPAPSFMTHPAPFFPKAVTPAPAPARIEPSFARMSAPVNEPATSAPFGSDADLPGIVFPEAVIPDAVAPETGQSLGVQPSQPVGQVFSQTISHTISKSEAPIATDPIAPALEPQRTVDAQLSDLLGDVMQAPLLAERSGLPVLETSFKAGAAPQVEHRAGFTISRDGYVPQPAKSAEPDPFDFDLGPSPFESKPVTVQAPVSHAVAASPFSEPVFSAASELNDDERAVLAGSGHVSDPVADAAPHSVLDMPRLSLPVIDIAAIEVPAVEARAPEAVSAEARRESFIVAAPSVAATLAPPVETPSRAEAFAMPASSVGQTAADATRREASTAVEPPPAAAAPERDVLTVETQHISTGANHSSAADAAETINPLAVIATPPAALSTEGGHRTMEDTVADLLRPMLRTWLAENMPRIVERALRREVSEQLHAEHKTAAE